MKVFTCTDFEGYWPVGTAAVVLASDAESAAVLLNEKLVAQCLPPSAKAEAMKQIPQTNPIAVVLCDGNY